MSDLNLDKRKPTRPLRYSMVRAFKCSPKDAERLDRLAEVYGSKSAAVREALVLLDKKVKRVRKAGGVR